MYSTVTTSPVSTRSPTVFTSASCPETPSETGILKVCTLDERFVTARVMRSESVPSCTYWPAVAGKCTQPSARPILSKSVVPDPARLNTAVSPFRGDVPPTQLPPVDHLPPSDSAPFHSTLTFSRPELLITSAPSTTARSASTPATMNFAMSASPTPDAITV